MRTPYERWRDNARTFLAAGIRPEHADWQHGLLAGPTPAHASAMPRVPAALVDLLQRAACHRDPARNALMYRLLWRVVHGGRRLLQHAADDDVMMVTRLAKAVDRASHKMKAFVRFRALRTEDSVRYVARFEPEHDVIMRTAGFFADRFPDMEWVIVTPDAIARWDRKTLEFLPPGEHVPAPGEDASETLWLAFCDTIFNPARLNVSPGATLDSCRRCPLWERATQAVPGVGPQQSPLMVVGEQPGDEEDLSGKPFVGPAGRVLRRAFDDAGIDRTAIYVTNAVKHFSFEPRGTRRIHKTPAQREIEACRVWLDEEIDTVRPQVIVALGASALSALMRKRLAVGSARDAALTHPSGARVVATYHPSAVLRAPDEQARAATFEALAYDLRNARALAGLVRPAPAPT